MKHLKTLSSLGLALMMTMALAVPAFAASESLASNQTEVTIESTVDGYQANYEAYRLMGLTSALNCSETHTHTKDCYIYSYKVNSKYTELLKTQLGITKPDTGKTLDQTIMDALSTYTAAADIRALAEDLADAIEADDTLTPDATLTTDDTATLEQGYWLIADVTETVEEGIIRSLIMLNTAGKPALTITAKDDKKLLDKAVNDPNPTIGQTVQYTLTYTLPANLAEYETYHFQVTDTLSSGLDFVTDSGTYSISVDTTAVTGVIPRFSDRVMTVDLGAHILANKAAYAGKEVTIQYQATVNANAIIASAGNKNEAVLEYTNDPSRDSYGTTSDQQYVSTYAIALKKVNKNGDPLANATFEFPFYVYETPANDGAYIYAGTTAGTGLTNRLTTPDDGEITVKGVKAGNYTVTEVEAPDGYNKLADPFVITATELTETQTNQTFYLDGDGNLTDVETTSTVTYVNENFAADIKVVVNKSGSELPSTGGMGTTVFYTVGGLLTASAVVLLITKKKLSNER